MHFGLTGIFLPKFRVFAHLFQANISIKPVIAGLPVPTRNFLPFLGFDRA